MANPPLQVRRVSKALGAEVRGFDFADVDAELAREIEQLLFEHRVLFSYGRPGGATARATIASFASS